MKILAVRIVPSRNTIHEIFFGPPTGFRWFIDLVGWINILFMWLSYSTYDFWYFKKHTSFSNGGFG